MPYLQTRNCPRKRGFTLIELLVVIAVISMLMSMLLPSLNKAKEATKQTVCLNNLKELTLGWTMYSQNNDYRLCSPHTDGLSTDPLWIYEGPVTSSNGIGGTEEAIYSGALWPYVENLEIYHCKTDRTGLLNNYALSHTMGSDLTRDGLVPVSRISNTAGKMVFIDAEHFPGTEWIANSFCPIDRNQIEWAKTSPRCNISIRHSEGCNVSFADGSSQKWNWQDPRTLEFATDSSMLTMSGVNNPDYRKVFEALKQQ